MRNPTGFPKKLPFEKMQFLVRKLDFKTYKARIFHPNIANIHKFSAKDIEDNVFQSPNTSTRSATPCATLPTKHPIPGGLGLLFGSLG